MDPSKPAISSTLGEAKYIDFTSLPDDAKHEDGSPALNRFSTTITRGHDFPGARVSCPLLCISFTLVTLANGYLGNALRRGGARSRGHDQKPSGWSCLGVVGREPL